jgi:hypothetical protein
MDTILKYIAVISAAGAGISFVIGLWKYLDERALEERTKRFQLYHNLMREISAFGESEENALPLTQQVAAICELQHFPEYSFSLRVPPSPLSGES